MLFSGCLHKSFHIQLKQIKLELIWKQIEADFHNQHTVYQTPGWYFVNYFSIGICFHTKIKMWFTSEQHINMQHLINVKLMWEYTNIEYYI